MTIPSISNYFTQNTYESSLTNKDKKTSPISDSFKVSEEIDLKEITAFNKKIEGDYSTYSAKELSELSYDEVKKNYDELKEQLDARLNAAKDILNSKSFGFYQTSLFEGYSNEEGEDNLKVHDTRQNEETQDLLNFKDKFKIVNFFENDAINEAIYSKYQDNAQVNYFQPTVIDNDGSLLYSRGDSQTIQGTSLEGILQAVQDAKEWNETHEDIGNNVDPSPFKDGYFINGEEITIAGKIFNLYDVNKKLEPTLPQESVNEESNEIKDSQETENEEETKNIKPDYSTYTFLQLKSISFEEAKENYDELEEVIDNALNIKGKLKNENTDDILAFKSQLERVNSLNNEQINKEIYEKLQDINDPELTIWSSKVISENLNDLQTGETHSIILNGEYLTNADISSKTEIKEEENINKEQKEEEDKKNISHMGENYVNLDYIINTTVYAVKNNQKTNESRPYTEELVNAYSNFISQYNQIRDSLN